MTASLLTASFNFRVFFQTYKLKSSATVLIYTSPLITLSLREFQQIRIVINYQVSPVLVRNSSCAITSGRRDRIGKAALIADSRQARWRREKDRDAEKKNQRGCSEGQKKDWQKEKTPDSFSPSLHFTSVKLYTSAIFAPETFPPCGLSALRVSLFTPRHYPKSDRHAQSQPNTQTDIHSHKKNN